MHECTVATHNLLVVLDERVVADLVTTVAAGADHRRAALHALCAQVLRPVSHYDGLTQSLAARTLTQCISSSPSPRALLANGFSCQVTVRLLAGLRRSLNPRVGTSGGGGASALYPCVICHTCGAMRRRVGRRDKAAVVSEPVAARAQTTLRHRAGAYLPVDTLRPRLAALLLPGLASGAGAGGGGAALDAQDVFRIHAEPYAPARTPAGAQHTMAQPPGVAAHRLSNSLWRADDVRVFSVGLPI